MTDKKETSAVSKSAERRDSPLTPFAKAYNDYFREVYEIQRALQSKDCDARQSYAKSAQEAAEKRDLDALQSANEQFRAALADAVNPQHMVDGVRRAFDAYHRALRAAFASQDASQLDAMGLWMVAH